MSLYRYIMLPFTLIALTFFGYDRVAAEWHRSQLRSELTSAAADTTPTALRQQPVERVRTALRQQEARARGRGESYSYDLRNFPDRIEVNVKSTYRTKITHYMGTQTLPSDFQLIFSLDR